MKANYRNKPKSNTNKIKNLMQACFSEGFAKGMNEGIKIYFDMAIIILGDKFRFSKDMINQFKEELTSLSQSLEQNNVTLKDISEAATEEYLA